jgi:predicted nuclease with RNAse H fold
MTGGVLGLDLTASSRRPTAAVALSVDLYPHLVAFVTDDAAIHDMARRLQPGLIAIDAPLTLPPEGERRSAEVGLFRLGIACWSTTHCSIIWQTACRGVSLARGLRAQGYEVVEVYPYASKVRLWGKPMPRKSTPQGMEFLRRRLGELLPGLRPHLSAVDHHLADAAVAAYTGWLHLRGRSQVVGGEDGPIVLPATA